MFSCLAFQGARHIMRQDRVNVMLGSLQVLRAGPAQYALSVGWSASWLAG